MGKSVSFSIFITDEMNNSTLCTPADKNCRKTSSISRTKFQNLNVSCIILQLSSLKPLKPGVKLRMKM